MICRKCCYASSYSERSVQVLSTRRCLHQNIVNGSKRGFRSTLKQHMDILDSKHASRNTKCTAFSDENGAEDKGAVLSLLDHVYESFVAPGQNYEGNKENERRMCEKIAVVVDTWVEKHGPVTLQMLTAMESRNPSVRLSSNNDRVYPQSIIETVGGRLTAHYLGLGSSISTTIVLQDTTEHKCEEVENSMPCTERRNMDDIIVSGESMQLLQQQAMALEATIGIRKAESIVQLLGRKRLSKEEIDRMQQIPDKNNAWRILEVLVRIEDRLERRGLLEEAFLPLNDDVQSSEDVDGFFEEDMEALSTTPMALYQEVRSCLRSTERFDTLLKDISADANSDAAQIKAALEELQDDIVFD
jgi:hypothetical protein